MMATLNAPDDRADRGVFLALAGLYACELLLRFTFYGFHVLAILDLQAHFQGRQAQANAWFHVFDGAAFVLCIVGGYVAGRAGKFPVYMFGAVAFVVAFSLLTASSNFPALVAALGMIGIGFGAAKPTLRALIGDQPKKESLSEMRRLIVYWIALIAVNVGALIGFLLLPFLRNQHSPRAAYFATAAASFCAVAIPFALKRKRFFRAEANVAPQRRWLTAEQIVVLGKLGFVYLFVVAFWTLYVQTATVYFMQSKTLDARALGGMWDPDFMRAVNPIFLIALSLIAFLWAKLPFVRLKLIAGPTTDYMFVGLGVLCAALACLLGGAVELNVPASPSIVWGFGIYGLFSLGELLLTIGVLSHTGRACPEDVSALGFAMFFVAVGIGNLFAGAAVWMISEPILHFAMGAIGLLCATLYFMVCKPLFLSAGQR